MTDQEATDFLNTVEQEGLWYAVDSYSTFPEIQCEEFHRLRRAFLEAGQLLQRYAHNQVPDYSPL